MKKAGYLATKYLIELGHKRIGFITGPITSAWFLPRFKGYQKALRKARIPLDWNLMKETNGADKNQDELVMEELFSLPDPPAAIFAANDYRALHILDYCRKHNL